MKQNYTSVGLPSHNQTASLAPLYLTISAFFSAWIIWVLLRLHFPDELAGESNKQAWLRLAVRCVLWLTPVFVYIKLVERHTLGAWLKLEQRWQRGLQMGMAVGLLFTLGPLFKLFTGRAHLSAPSLDVLLNPILSGPLVEELLFRAVIYRKLSETRSALLAITLSSALFMLIHLPYWYLSGTKAGADLLMSLAFIFFIGAVLALVYRYSDSFWAPLLVHFINNLASQIIK